MKKHNALNHIAKGILVACIVVLLVVTYSITKADIPTTFFAGFIEVRDVSTNQEWVVVESYNFPTMTSCANWLGTFTSTPNVRQSCKPAGLLKPSA